MEEAVLGQAPENSSWRLEDQEEIQEVQLITIAPSIQISLFYSHVAVSNYPTEKPVAVGQRSQSIFVVIVIEIAIALFWET